MKTYSKIVLASIAFSLSSTLGFSQIFTPNNVRGGILGAGIGAVIGHQSDRTGKGALIGGAAGYIISDLSDRRSYRQPAYSHTNRYYYHSYTPAYYQSRTSRNINGALLGGLAGGVIGHQSNRSVKGAAIGAAAGYILSDLSSTSQRKTSRYYSSPRTYQIAPPYSRYSTSQYDTRYERQPQIIIINNYYGGSSVNGSANALFGR
jgi:uncharacterized protein YcfJ